MSLDDCGHWPHIDAPDTVATAITDFLDQHAAARRHGLRVAARA